MRYIKAQTFRLVLSFLVAGGSSAAQTAAQPVAPARIYEHMFRHVNFSKGLADAAAAKGDHSVHFTAYYAKLASLTQQQADQLGDIALSIAIQLKQKDAQAAAIIRAWKPSADSTPGHNPMLPPAFATLQQERKNIIVAGQNQLMQALGADVFARLDQALVSKTTVKSTAVTQPTGK